VGQVITWLGVSAEAIALSVVLLALFRLRSRWGWAPLISVLASVQLLPLVARSEVDLVGATVERGWFVVYGSLALVFLVAHVRDGPHRARQVMGSLLASFVVAASLAGLWSLYQAPEVAVRTALGVRFGVVRTMLIFFDAVAVLATWEVLGRLVRPALPRILGALGLPLAFDGLCVALARGVFTGDTWSTDVLGTLAAAGLAAGVHGVVGYVYLARIEDPRWLEPERDRPLLDVLAVMTGSRRYVPLRADQIRDAESGLYDRLFFEDNLHPEVLRADTYASSLALLVLQVDAPGPDPTVVGRVLMGSLRITDLPCRIGPTRYAALLPGADRGTCQPTVARLLEGLAAHRTTLSVGIAVFPEDGLTGDKLVEAAEQDRRRMGARGPG
jgi:GGDEF domain-containing protein